MPLPSGEEGEYVLALKQELRGAMRQLPYFIRPAVPKRGQLECSQCLRLSITRGQRCRERLRSSPSNWGDNNA